MKSWWRGISRNFKVMRVGKILSFRVVFKCEAIWVLHAVRHRLKIPDLIKKQMYLVFNNKFCSPKFKKGWRKPVDIAYCLPSVQENLFAGKTGKQNIFILRAK